MRVKARAETTTRGWSSCSTTRAVFHNVHQLYRSHRESSASERATGCVELGHRLISKRMETSIFLFWNIYVFPRLLYHEIEDIDIYISFKGTVRGHVLYGRGHSSRPRGKLAPSKFRYFFFDSFFFGYLFLYVYIPGVVQLGLWPRRVYNYTIHTPTCYIPSFVRSFIIFLLFTTCTHSRGPTHTHARSRSTG